MAVAKRTAGLVAAVLVGAAALPASSPAAAATRESERHSTAKHPARLVAKTGAYSGDGYDYFVRGTLFRDGERYGGRRVVLQARVDGRWQAIDRDRTSVFGAVTWYFKPSPVRWRLRFGGDDGTRPTTSHRFGFGAGLLAQAEPALDPAALVGK